MNNLFRRRRWRKMKKSETSETENLLKLNERRCMNACSRYLGRNPERDNVWTLHCPSSNSGDLCGVIVQVKNSLLPVLPPAFARNGLKKIPEPYFLQNFFGMAYVHSVQGSKEDTLLLEAALDRMGLSTSENIDYDTMCIDRPPGGFRPSGPAKLIIRKPENADLDALAALHGAYEKEEVLPARSQFDAAVSRYNTERIFNKEEMLIAELDGRPVGKINTNAVTFTRRQIGGVYVLPEYRGRGIATRLAWEFTASLAAQNRGISLFVKKSNPAARKVYQNIGFEIIGDYRISYYQS